MKLPLTRHTHRLSGKGFSLVITITLMLLLSLLAVGMLSLSTVGLRSARHTSAAVEARANARVALNLAIGQLQKHAGPDQRVTAESAFGGSAGPLAEPGDIAHPHWVGVWRTTLEDGSPIFRPRNRPPVPELVHPQAHAPGNPWPTPPFYAGMRGERQETRSSLVG